jgi:plasmid recombination enzyme
MSYCVARMEKMKSDNLVGIGNHNQRRFSNHSNKDIDVSKSHLNYDILDKVKSYKTDIEGYINANKSSKRAVRKDAVLVCEWIITSDSDFFESMSPADTREYFQTAIDFFAERYGSKNLMYAQVHLDERTPHMHLGIVPFDKDNKLTAKTMFDREALQDIQNELPRYMNERGFKVERGRAGSEAKHLTVQEYKDVQKEIKKQSEVLDGVKKELESVKNVTRTKDFLDELDSKSKKTLLGNDVKISQKDYQELKEQLLGADKSLLEMDKLKQHNQKLSRSIYDLRDELDDSKAYADRLYDKNDSLKEQIKHLDSSLGDFEMAQIAYQDALSRELSQDEIIARYICHEVELGNIPEDESDIEYYIDTLNSVEIDDNTLKNRVEKVIDILKNVLENVLEFFRKF